MTTAIILKPKVELLNSNFDGYKLKSDPYQSVHSRQIENGIFQNPVSDAPCYLFTRMESLHNHLFNDCFDDNSVYVFNQKGHLLLYSFCDNYVGTPAVVWQEDLENQSQPNSFRYSPSISFPSSNYALATNGNGLLNILQTGDRDLKSSWLSLKELRIASGTIVSSVHVTNPVDSDSQQEIHVLLLSVRLLEDLKNDPLCQTLDDNLLNSKVCALHIINWLSFGFDGTKWELARERSLAGFNNLEYISLDHSGQGVILLNHDNYYFIYDSMIPVQEHKEKTKNMAKNILYFFMQDNEEIKVWVNAGPDIRKEEIIIDIKDIEIKIQVKQKIVLQKTFLHPTDSCAATWTLENGRLEVCIPKTTENELWSGMFEGGDEEGEEIISSSLAHEIHERLSYLTSDQLDLTPDPERPAFNPDQLEACDDASDDLFLTILDGTKHAVSHISHLGAVQHLFNTNLENSVIPSFCLRHDVDGILWRLDDDRNFDHVATFHAFGYVKASKSKAKFTKGSPNNSYVAVADVNSHVYVFCQPDCFGGELRNRKSGKVSTVIARQLIISLSCHDEVMGFYPAPNCIFVLTSKELFVYTLQS